MTRFESRATERFWRAFRELPGVQRSARKAFRLWKNDPYHRGLRFKQVHKTLPVYSVRVALGWRAVGMREDASMIWFWIGSHAEYDRLLANL